MKTKKNKTTMPIPGMIIEVNEKNPKNKSIAKKIGGNNWIVKNVETISNCEGVRELNLSLICYPKVSLRKYNDSHKKSDFFE